jgi:hypothetical protein
VTLPPDRDMRTNSAQSPGDHDRYARQTAADRPGIAQPVPVRPVPEQPWGRILLGTVVLLALLVAGWEAYWRNYGVRPSIANSDGLWAMQRRRIDAGEGDATVLLGSSRLLYDMQLPVWERLDGRRPIQLSLEGTGPTAMVEDLAQDAHYTGRLVIGIAPQQFFAAFKRRVGVLRYLRKESPSQRIGQWLSMQWIEPYLAFDDPDFALQTVLERQPWPKRPGLPALLPVRKISEIEADRNAHVWAKVATDPEYCAIVRRAWVVDLLTPSPQDPSPTEVQRIANDQIDRTARAVAKLRARGVKVLFVRLPSSGPFLEFEERTFPRARTWDSLLAATAAPGIHFQDYPELQGYTLPEWSHVSPFEADRLTQALYGIIQRDFWGPDAPVGATRPRPPPQRADVTR